MKGRLFLIHWDLTEAEELTLALRSHGWQVECEHDSGNRAVGSIMVHPPDKVIIYLTRKPARGLKTARELRSTLWGHDLPIIFVGGRGQAEADFPAATFTTEEGLFKALEGAG